MFAHHKFPMADFKTIIVGVDLSAESKDLVKRSSQLASKWGAKLVLAHVVHIDPTMEINFATVLPWEDARAEKEKEIRMFYNVSADVEIKFGKPDDEIAHLAEKYKNPLILVGHSTKGWLGKLFAGSTARGLATRFDLPVLIY